MAATSNRQTASALLLGVAGIAAFAVGASLARQGATPRVPSCPDHVEPLAVQFEPAREQGRGRQAPSPRHIPWRGWKDILYRTFVGITAHRLLALAASAVFFDILAVFPAIAALVSIYGLFASGAQIRHHLVLLATIVPSAAIDILGDQIDRISARSGGNLSVTFLLSLAISIWSANAGIKAMFDALNVIYDEDEKRSFLRLNAISLLFTVGSLVFLLVALAGVVAAPLIFAGFGVAHGGIMSIALLRWPILFVIVAAALSLLYRFGPSRRPAKWRWVSVGSLVGTLTWLVGSAGFSWYLSHVADYNATYGSLGAAVGFMTWLWLSAIVVLLSAQLNAEIEHQTARDSTVGSSERPIGQRHAVMADTVGAAQG